MYRFIWDSVYTLAIHNTDIYSCTTLLSTIELIKSTTQYQERDTTRVPRLKCYTRKVRRKIVPVIN